MKEFMPLINPSTKSIQHTKNNNKYLRILNFLLFEAAFPQIPILRKEKKLLGKDLINFYSLVQLTCLIQQIQFILNKVNLRIAIFLSSSSVLPPFKSRNYSQIKSINKVAFMEFICVQMDFGKKLLWMIIFLAVQVQYSQEKTENGYFCWEKLMLNYMESGIVGCTLRDLTEALNKYFIRNGETQQDINYVWSSQKKISNKNTYWRHLHQKKINSIIRQFQIYKRLLEVMGYQIQSLRQEILGLKKNGQKTGMIILTQIEVIVKKKDKVFWKNDGIFWMSIKDFLTEFCEVCVCQFNPDYLYTATTLKVDKLDTVTKKVVLMKVYQKTHPSISLTQSDKRLFQNADQLLVNQTKILKRYQIIQAMLLKMIGILFVEKIFEPGYQTLYVEVEWGQNYDRYLAFSSYGSNLVQFSQLQFLFGQEEIAIKTILDGLLTAHQRDTDDEVIKDIEPGIIRRSGEVAGYNYFWYKHQTTTKIFQQVLQMEKIQNLEICFPYQNSGEVQVQCNPETIVIVRVNKQDGGAFSFALKCLTQIIEVKSEQDIFKQVLHNPDQKFQRSFQGKIQYYTQNRIYIFLYIVKFPTGVAIFYENKESSTYQETSKFEVNNLEGVRIDISKDVVLEIPPEQSKLIQLQSIDTSKTYSQKQCVYFKLI
ncbi:unnamed protein product [Paramecium pentaurelia]|uniref:Uncharacterized protein n=1 Tax=Paramecium pentaurelia TaxID=43138 RepID=A0A8S1XSD2_9CILI|nr:unnamed protein product [Paramecium pentaurelia]